MKLITKNIPYIIIGILLVLIFFKSCGGNEKGSTPDDVETKTTYVTRTIKGETITKKETIFVPKVVYKVDEEYIIAVEKLMDENERLKYLLDKISTRVYDTTYVLNRGTLRVKDSIHGYLKGREWSLVIDDIEYEEATITNTIKKYPKFVISAGPSVQMTTDFNTYLGRPTLGGEIGFRNKNGFSLDFGINLRKDLNITLKKDIFVLY